MPPDDLASLRAEWLRLASADLLMDGVTMTDPERSALAEQMRSIAERLTKAEHAAEEFRTEVREGMAGVKADLDRIKGMARLAAWFVTAFGGLTALAAAVMVYVERGG